MWSLSILDGFTCLGTFGVTETMIINGQTFNTSEQIYLPTAQMTSAYLESIVAEVTLPLVIPEVVTLVFSSRT